MGAPPVSAPPAAPAPPTPAPPTPTPPAPEVVVPLPGGLLLPDDPITLGDPSQGAPAVVE